MINFNDPNRECCAEEERAAIMEYEGGMSRANAEKESGLLAMKNRQIIEQETARIKEQRKVK